MSGILSILDIAWSGLYSHQKALEVTGHNIANADTKGYHRQEVVLETSIPVRNELGYSGTGVDVAMVRRYKNALYDLHVRDENSSLERCETTKQTLDQLEAIFKEPTTNGFSSRLNAFWDSWENLANNPEDSSARAGVREAGRGLCQDLNLIADQLAEIRKNLNDGAENTVSTINELAQRIAQVNADIDVALKGGNSPNDQLDRRDELLNELANLVNIRVIEGEDNKITVYISNDMLLSDTQVREIASERETIGDATITNFYWKGTDRALDVRDGKLKGMIESRDEIVQEVIDKLDTIASTLIEQVNTLHEGGVALDGTSGNKFFQPYTASDGSSRGAAQNIRLSDVVENSLTKIAAASPGGTLPGDNSNALAIADLRQQNLMESGRATINEYYAEAIAEIGYTAQTAEMRRDNHRLASRQFENMRSAASGVSLDEEMTQIIRYQHGYNAAARLIRVADDLMNVLINLGR